MHILRDKSVKMQFLKFMLTNLMMLDTARWHEGKKSIMLLERPGIETSQGDNFFRLMKCFTK